MRYFQLLIRGESHLAVETSDDTLVDLTTISPHATGVIELLRAAALVGTDIDQIARAIVDRSSGGMTISLADVEDATAEGGHGPRFGLPLVPPEVWAVGVTYQDSMRERQAESETPDVYAKVYASERPEVFFKATPGRVSGPFEEVGIRADSDWDVPEPELAFVLFDGAVAGYTVGNDMSSRTIEGENPLYLPQAKVYDKSAALGPALATPETVGDPQKLAVTLLIERDGSEVFRGEANTSEMKRDCAYLADWLIRHNTVPDGTTAMTGTGTIPPPGFTLAAGDVVHVTIEKIGTLTNTVVVV